MVGSPIPLMKCMQDPGGHTQPAPGVHTGNSDVNSTTWLPGFSNSLTPDWQRSNNNTGGFPGGSVVKNTPAKQETQVRSPIREDPLEEEMATHSSTLAWTIPWTEEPGGL